MTKILRGVLETWGDKLLFRLQWATIIQLWCENKNKQWLHENSSNRKITCNKLENCQIQIANSYYTENKIKIDRVKYDIIRILSKGTKTDMKDKELLDFFLNDKNNLMQITLVNYAREDLLERL